MSFILTLEIEIPVAPNPNHPFNVTRVDAVRAALGGDADGLSDKEADELFCRRAFQDAYTKQDQRVGGAADSAADRASIDVARSTIADREADILTDRLARRAQAETDWA